jgi:hypothetical protein
MSLSVEFERHTPRLGVYFRGEMEKQFQKSFESLQGYIVKDLAMSETSLNPGSGIVMFAASLASETDQAASKLTAKGGKDILDSTKIGADTAADESDSDDETASYDFLY